MIRNMTKQIDKLAALRAEMKKQALDGVLVPKEDEFQGEYIPACAERLAWLTGFTGSAGAAVVLMDRALVQSDSRYTLRLKAQVDQALFSTQESKDGQGVAEWLLENAAEKSVIGYDPRLHRISEIQSLESKLKSGNIRLKPLEKNMIDIIWQDRPAAPMDKVEAFPDSIAGLSANDKREDITAAVVKSGAVAAIITMPDSVAWLLNIRGNDVPHTPFALSNAIIHDNGNIDWFIDPAKIPAEVRSHIGNHVQINAPDTLPDALRALAQTSAKQKKPVLLDYKNSSIWFKQMLEAAGGTLKDAEDVCLLAKACKNPTEQNHIRTAHKRDGVAETKFLIWFEREAPKGYLTEISVAEKLEEFRRQGQNFRDTSFGTIAGWNANGADVHYHATPESSAVIKSPGILLLDSGAQYQDGTTDITRTIAVGTPTAEQKKANTLVLKGHIAIAACTFPAGTRGVDIDILARQALLKHGMNYGHGTGHGVGLYLSVHEQGGGISKAAMRPFKPGMLVSNEPGYYREGKFGIRIENLIMVAENGLMEDGKTQSLKFETVTLVPIDKNLIDKSLLNSEEIDWLNDYHARVEREIAPHLDSDEKVWLKKACAPL